MAIGPTVRRRRLGSELRRLREARSINLEVVADRLGLAASTLSRIENGKAPTKTAYLTALLEVYEVTDPEQRQILIDMAREGHRKGWWAGYEDVLPTGFGIYVGLEADASGLRIYETQVVNGLLQTPEYAKAILREVNKKDSPDQLQRATELRIKRQYTVEKPDPPDLWLILDEAVIRRPIGGPEVMASQLKHLVEASHWPNVTLQVLPFSAGAHSALPGPFTILEFPERTDDDVVYLDSWGGPIYLEKERDVRMCAEAFDRLRAAALSTNDSVALANQVAGQLM
ncbi:MAG TPA: helix-turn-helix transcriptional regulator [Streptosporangiaceae bacterium]|nr:helix-turn-helix transcriptional regulator [Streptosporangiaceae bacterium]